MDHGLPSRQTVNAVGGCLRARDIAVVTRLWTLDGLRTAQTSVTHVVAATARATVEVVTGHTAFSVAAGLPLATPDGWVRAEDAAGKAVAWTHARQLCRERLTFRMGYAFGYFVGATCADGTVGKNYVSLVVNDEAFAARYARSLRKGLASHLILGDRWAARGTFRPEHHDADPVESGWVTVEAVRPRVAPGKPFTLYSYRLRPHPTFLVNGHLVREAE
ncbi:hypothetical protein OG323_21170 [Streptomyces cyaneofuscatus]|uniref:hypothetical protein n=1 Tax=Streptomyces cyaneofuscatus TaxID=66883 RepID=UPI00386D96A8|nr:hypothetical protein OG323_21170 [Streptomyces cyaneofuscatus]